MGLSGRQWLALAGLVFTPAVALAQPATPAVQGNGLPSLAPLVESVKAAVVNVDVRARPSRAGTGADEMGDELFEHFFGGRRRGGQAPLRSGMGSGFIVDSKGLVLTNNHVIEGAVNIRVRLDDGRAFEGEVLGRDPLTDIALIKLKGKVEQLPSVKLGDSSTLRVGDWVVAIGNPFGLSSTVSAGILSARARSIGTSQYDDFLQTDAAINPGNSGGPLFNLKGEVIGINTAIVGGGTGIGFAVPSNLVKAVLPQLEKDGAVTRGYLGIGIQDLTAALAKGLGVPATEGALVTKVNDGSPGQKGGLKVEDVVVAVEGEKIGSAGALTRLIALKRPDSQVTLKVYRAGKPLDLKVKLGTRPDIEGIGVLKRPEAQEQTQEKVGLALRDMDGRQGGPSGALVQAVTPGSPAEVADLQPGMVIVEVNKKPVKSSAELIKVIKSSAPGSTLLLRVQAQGSDSQLLRALQLP